MQVLEFKDKKFKDEDIHLIENLHYHRYVNCEFTYCDFNKAILYDSEFEDCTFKNCSFQKSEFTKLLFTKCGFYNCSLIGSKWVNCKIYGNTIFNNCNLTYSRFYDCNLVTVSFEKIKFEEAQLINSNFVHISFHETDFGNSMLISKTTFDSIGGIKIVTVTPVGDSNHYPIIYFPEQDTISYRLGHTVSMGYFKDKIIQYKESDPSLYAWYLNTITYLESIFGNPK